MKILTVTTLSIQKSELGELRLVDIIPRSQELIISTARNTSQHYTTHAIQKPNGGIREIHCPSKQIKELCKCLLAFLNKIATVSKHAHGGVKGRSTETCAIPHVGQLFVSTHDITNFFPSVLTSQVLEVFLSIGIQKEVAKILSELATVDGRLPQGAPTSPMLANLCLANIDRSIGRYSRSNNLKYTRYLDDLILSGPAMDLGIKGTIKSTLSRSGFELSEAKSTFAGPGQIHQVLGFTVNDKLQPSKQYIVQLEFDIRVAIEHGISVFAAAEHISMKKAKDRLNGRVQYLEQHKVKQAGRLRGLLNDVKWSE